MVNMDAQHLVLTESLGPVSKKKSLGTRGYWCGPILMDYPKTSRSQIGRVSHSFLVMPNCSYPLLDRELLTKIGAQTPFERGKITVIDPERKPIQVLIV